MRRLAAALLLGSSCIPDQGPMMAPFQDCVSCHSGGEAPAWTVAGTWYKGARVTLTDANGKSFTVKGNQAGNFYTAEGLALPITVSVDGVLMASSTSRTTPMHPPYGGCNACHQAWAVITGPNMSPGSNCLASGCHSPGGVGITFVAAGTFPGSATVSLPNGTPKPGGTCSSPTTAGGNTVGNFYIKASGCAAAFPTNATVAGKGTMSPAPRGGCNGGGCHDRNGGGGEGG
jgi:hypothetical protein